MKIPPVPTQATQQGTPVGQASASGGQASGGQDLAALFTSLIRGNGTSGSLGERLASGLGGASGLMQEHTQAMQQMRRESRFEGVEAVRVDLAEELERDVGAGGVDGTEARHVGQVGLCVGDGFGVVEVHADEQSHGR